jgi:hypothetical protein
VIARRRQRAGRLLITVLILAGLILLLVTPFTFTAAGQTPWGQAATLFTVLAGVVLGVVHGVLLDGARRSIYELYGIDRRTGPSLKMYQMRTLGQFDNWLAAHGKSVADRDPRRLEGPRAVRCGLG